MLSKECKQLADKFNLLFQLNCASPSLSSPSLLFVYLPLPPVLPSSLIPFSVPPTPFLSLPSCPLLCSYLLSGVIDQSGIKITYLSKPRTHNAGMAFTGHGVTPIMITPPAVDEFTVIGNCNSDCTEKVRSHMLSRYIIIAFKTVYYV